MSNLGFIAAKHETSFLESQVRSTSRMNEIVFKVF